MRSAFTFVHTSVLCLLTMGKWHTSAACRNVAKALLVETWCVQPSWYASPSQKEMHRHGDGNPQQEWVSSQLHCNCDGSQVRQAFSIKSHWSNKKYLGDFGVYDNRYANLMHGNFGRLRSCLGCGWKDWISWIDSSRVISHQFWYQGCKILLNTPKLYIFAQLCSA